MAKIILKSNLRTRTYFVEHKIIETPVDKEITVNSIEVLITPSSGYIIDAKDFSVGVLPREISFITFQNKGKKVIANVNFNSFIVSSETRTIMLPISGQPRINSGEVHIEETTSVDPNIIVTGFSGSKNITGTPGSTVLVATKTFTIIDGYKFNKRPDYKIQGNSTRYRVARRQTKESYTFEFFYTFPVQNTTSQNSDILSFSASSKAIPSIKKNIEYAENKEDFKIYSVDTGPSLNIIGGTKKVTVKGIPGTPFKVLVQNTAKQVYDFTNGAFREGGKFLEGVIPVARPGVGYGEFRAFVKVPASTAANKITTRILTDNPITTMGVNLTGSAETTEATDVSVIEETIDSTCTLTLEMKDTGVTGIDIYRPALYGDSPTAVQLTQGIPDGTYSVGPGSRATTITEYLSVTPVINYEGDTINVYTFILRPNQDLHLIRIARQPLFSPGLTFQAWGGDTLETSGDNRVQKLKDSDGALIVSDWDNISTADWTINSIETEVTGNATHEVTIGSDTYEAHTEVTVQITINGIFGTDNINPELRLLNFLELHT